MATATAPDQDTRRFLGRIESAVATVKAWDEDPTLLAECRAQIPMEQVNQNYTRDDDVLYRGNALFLKHLTLYFKENVMSWVNQPSCTKCGNESMESRTTRGPETQEEREGGASRVEVYNCPSCNDATTTFPRYNSVRKLLETRKGRCGEYANLFGLYCRAVGFEVRYCADFTDHVWVECLVDGEWIMADACEGMIDKASMYEDGWGKDLSYIIGVTTDSVVDVTPRYTRKWFNPDFQARRRAVCSSEEQSQHIVKQCNATLQQSCSENRRAELNRRLEREQRMLGAYQQATEWTDAEKHGEGRISGSLQWKLSRKEAGSKGEVKGEEEKAPSVRSWHVETFYPRSDGVLQILVSPDGIVVSGAKCSVVGSDISVVVIDEKHLGCILQSRGFHSWRDVSDFVETLPSHRIVAFQGRERGENIIGDSETRIGLSRLGGLTIPDEEGNVLYLGQVDANPAWAKCTSKTGFEVIFHSTKTGSSLKLRTERDTSPSRIAWRLPETTMPLQTQLMASEEQKRLAFLRFSEQRNGNSTQYVGYTTKEGSPIYLLDASAYPLSKSEGGWNTFHFLPKPLVPEDDVGVVDKTNKSSVPKVDIPLDSFFFTSLLGPNLVSNGAPGSPPELVDTAVALHNSRLVALYFSAHWCGPCRQFTPILAELYSHLKEEYPSHGMEIVFVSSDRDSSSFQQYYGSMPWMAVPFEMGAIPQIKARLGVRGIPALIVLDSVSGQIVVPASDSRREVMQACQRGDEGIEDMLESWIARTPQESQEILAMLELSVEDNNEVDANNKEHPYFLKSEEASPVKDPAAVIKEMFARLVAEGAEPNVAAARAIQMVAEQQKTGSTPLEPGPLNDIDWTSTIVDSNTELSEAEREFRHSKKRFLLFTRVLMKYLEQKDPAMQLKAKAVIQECAEKHKQNQAGYESVTSIMRTRLRDLVGETYWAQADAYLVYFLKEKEKIEKEKSDSSQQQSSKSSALPSSSSIGSSAPSEPGRLNDFDWKSLDTNSWSPDELAIRVAILNENNKDAVATVVSTTLKYLENAKKEPWTPKFRSFKLSNKVVDRITRVEGALDLLCSLGLYIYPTETDFMACIPLSADLDVMEASMKELLTKESVPA